MEAKRKGRLGCGHEGLLVDVANQPRACSSLDGEKKPASERTNGREARRKRQQRPPPQQRGELSGAPATRTHFARASQPAAGSSERERALATTKERGGAACLPGLAGAAASKPPAKRRHRGTPTKHGRRTCSLPGKETAVRRQPTTTRHVRDGATSGRTGLRRHVAPSPQRTCAPSLMRRAFCLPSYLLFSFLSLAWTSAAVLFPVFPFVGGPFLSWKRSIVCCGARESFSIFIRERRVCCLLTSLLIQLRAVGMDRRVSASNFALFAELVPSLIHARIFRINPREFLPLF